jgi:hexosaminidase
MRLPHSLRSSAARALALTAALALLPQDTTAQGTAPRHAIIPAPNRIELARTGTFTITDSTVVFIAADASDDVERVGRQLATMLGPGASRAPRRLPESITPLPGSIRLVTNPRLADLGAEGYLLDVRTDGVVITARAATGLFYGMQSLRQLLPWSIEHRAALNRQLTLPVGEIRDVPRFAWRGAMLDVARHFLPLEDVKRYVDAMALYKLNVLHLHLADDQGWRIEIRSRPNLTKHGGSTQVGGGPGGFYTQAEYRDLVAYAAERRIIIVPEIDMPGHTNAALASYPELTCDGVAPPLYTGIRVGFSAVCPDKEATYTFVQDVVRELAALTPTPYLHLGGDEVEKLTSAQYRAFVERVEGIVRAAGKRMIGWGEIAPANLDRSTIVQHWRSDAKASRDSAHLHAARGGSVIMSPGNRTYLDMKYDSTTVLGLRWAGLISVEHAYSWEPSTFLPRVPAEQVLGVEAPLWAETLVRRSDYEYLAFPRLIAIAELGWSRPNVRGWDGFRARLAEHGPRLQAIGVNFYRSPEIPWK